MKLALRLTMISVRYCDNPIDEEVPLTMQCFKLKRTLLAAVTALFFTSITALATPPVATPAPPSIDAKGFVLMDANSGIVIAQQNANERMAPASLTKLMTLYVTFQALQNNQIHLEDPVHISEQAWRTGGSRMFVKVGTDVSLEDLIQGVTVASGNDACVAMAEYVGGNEPSFAQIMNDTAKRLGMENSHYVDSNGLPSADHYSTPYDMAILARSIIQTYPQYYHYFSEKWFTYNNIKQPNRNRLLWRDPTVDGLKTGHTDDAGYCLIASSNRDDMRLIAVVMGSPSDGARTEAAQALLNYGFRYYQTYKVLEGNQTIATPRVWLGEEKHGQLGLAQPLFVTVPRGNHENVKATINVQPKLKAPLKKGEVYGQVTVTVNDTVISTTPVIALKDDLRAGWWRRVTDRIAMTIRGLLGHG